MSSVESVDGLIRRMGKVGYVIFRTCKEGAPNLNLVVSRALPGTCNAFDDQLVAFWWDEIDQLHSRSWQVTADPGLYWLQNPSRATGTAVLCHDQQIHKGFMLGKHHPGQAGEYDCLVQTRPLTVWRDANKDGIVDYCGKTYTDSQGIQVHKAGKSSTKVEKWSAGCIVFAVEKEFDEEFMPLVKQSAKVYGNSFTLTILGSLRW